MGIGLAPRRGQIAQHTRKSRCARQASGHTVLPAITSPKPASKVSTAQPHPISKASGRPSMPLRYAVTLRELTMDSLFRR
jgi:hypothetical protein